MRRNAEESRNRKKKTSAGRSKSSKPNEHNYWPRPKNSNAGTIAFVVMKNNAKRAAAAVFKLKDSTKKTSTAAVFKLKNSTKKTSAAAVVKLKGSAQNSAAAANEKNDANPNTKGTATTFI